MFSYKNLIIRPKDIADIDKIKNATDAIIGTIIKINSSSFIFYNPRNSLKHHSFLIR